MLMREGVDQWAKKAARLFLPNEHLKKVTDISSESLAKDGYKTYVLDVDNTLMTYSDREVSLENAQWVFRAKERGFSVYLVSNNSHRRRIERVAKQLDVVGTYFACKPLTYAVKDVAIRFSFSLETAVVVGDQRFKDTICGNWLGAYTILVDPIDPETSRLDQARQRLEYLGHQWLEKRL